MRFPDWLRGEVVWVGIAVGLAFLCRCKPSNDRNNQENVQSPPNAEVSYHSVSGLPEINEPEKYENPDWLKKSNNREKPKPITSEPSPDHPLYPPREGFGRR